MSVHGLPSSTEIKKLVHKKLLYAKFPKELCGERRKQFDDDIGRIVVTNEISPVSVNIKEGEQVKSSLKPKRTMKETLCLYRNCSDSIC